MTQIITPKLDVRVSNTLFSSISKSIPLFTMRSSIGFCTTALQTTNKIKVYVVAEVLRVIPTSAMLTAKGKSSSEIVPSTEIKRTKFIRAIVIKAFRLKSLI